MLILNQKSMIHYISLNTNCRLLSEKMISPYIENYSSSNEQASQNTAVEYEGFSPDFRIPDCYIMENLPPVNVQALKNFPEKVLFYIFFNMHHERAQVQAAKQLTERGWTYDEETMKWFKKKSSNTIVFDPINWVEQVLQE